MKMLIVIKNVISYMILQKMFGGMMRFSYIRKQNDTNLF